MATFTKVTLSGSTQGRQIKIAPITSPGTTIHETGTSSSVVDEVWLWAYNSGFTDSVLTVQFGSTSTPDDDIKLSIPATSGLTLVVPGLILTGTGSAANTVRAWANDANLIMVSGYVNRIS